MAGLDLTGFVQKTLDEIKTEIENEFFAAPNFGPSAKVTADSVNGVIIGIISGVVKELWEVSQAVYASQYPDSASGIALDNVCAITGVTRLPATNSTVTVTATGTPATLIPAGTVFSVLTAGDRFVTLADATIGGGGTVAIDCEAEETGPVQALAGTLTVIETPVGGLSSVTNALDAELGRNLETDAELRIRRAQLLRATGNATVEAIRSKLREVDSVDEVYVFENDTDVTDGDGLPPHSFEAVVRGGLDQDIVDSIWATKGAGIATYGSDSGTAVDSMGFSHTINFSRPTETDIYIIIDIEVDGNFPSPASAGKDQVKAALAAFGDSLNIGADVIAAKLKCEAFEVPGVVDILSFKIDDAPAPTIEQNITIGNREIANFDTSNITVLINGV